MAGLAVGMILDGQSMSMSKLLWWATDRNGLVAAFELGTAAVVPHGARIGGGMGQSAHADRGLDIRRLVLWWRALNWNADEEDAASEVDVAAEPDYYFVVPKNAEGVAFVRELDACDEVQPGSFVTREPVAPAEVTRWLEGFEATRCRPCDAAELGLLLEHGAFVQRADAPLRYRRDCQPCLRRADVAPEWQRALQEATLDIDFHSSQSDELRLTQLCKTGAVRAVAPTALSAAQASALEHAFAARLSRNARRAEPAAHELYEGTFDTDTVVLPEAACGRPFRLRRPLALGDFATYAAAVASVVCLLWAVLGGGLVWWLATSLSALWVLAANRWGDPQEVHVQGDTVTVSRDGWRRRYGLADYPHRGGVVYFHGVVKLRHLAREHGSTSLQLRALEWVRCTAAGSAYQQRVYEDNPRNDYPPGYLLSLDDKRIEGISTPLWCGPHWTVHPRALREATEERSVVFVPCKQYQDYLPVTERADEVIVLAHPESSADEMIDALDGTHIEVYDK